MHWPQYTIIVLYALVAGVMLAKHGEPRTGNYNFTASLIASVIQLGLLYAGGFFA